MTVRDKQSVSRLEQAVKEECTRLGIQESKPEQWEAVQLLLEGTSMFVTLPTGYGKSAIYQVLPLCTIAFLEADSPQPLVVVFSPLVFLRRDQLTKLRRSGLQAVAIGINDVDREDVRACRFTYIFCSPEALLQGEKWRNVILSKEFATAVCIDEAHCIVKWQVYTMNIE